MRQIILAISVICVFSIFTSGQTNKKYDTPVKIISKPRAKFPEQKNGTICVQGAVTLRVQFLETGEIGNIFVVSGLPDEFNERAVEAAKEIKFKPALKNRKPVAVFKTVQYSFSLY